MMDGHTGDECDAHDRVKCDVCGHTFDISETYCAGSGSACMDCVQEVLDSFVDQARWRVFPDETPPTTSPCDYLTRCGNGERQVCQWRDGVWWLDIPEIIMSREDNITHWLPIPPVPADLPPYEA